jgi:hypothetical protein
MPRKYERKIDTQTKAQQAHQTLRTVLETEAEPSGYPRSRGFPKFTEFDDTFHETFGRLMAWLRRLRKEPVAYSALLQVWLEHMNVEFQGVFKDDIFNSAKRGRPSRQELGRKAFRLYKKGTFGHAKVAKELDAAGYKRNRNTAVKRVRDALAAYERRRTSLRHDPKDAVRKLAAKMLGFPDENLD